MGDFKQRRLAAAPRACAPPRISPSCPHYVPLWLDRCTIIRGRVIAKQLAKAASGMDGAARHLIGPSLYRKSVQVVFAHPPHRFFHFWLIRLMSFQSLDMFFSSCTRRTEKVPSMHRPREQLFFRTIFEKFFYFFSSIWRVANSPHLRASFDYVLQRHKCQYFQVLCSAF